MRILLLFLIFSISIAGLAKNHSKIIENSEVTSLVESVVEKTGDTEGNIHPEFSYHEPIENNCFYEFSQKYLENINLVAKSIDHDAYSSPYLPHAPPFYI